MTLGRSILLIGAAILGLLVLVVTVVLVAGGREPQRYPPDSPRGVVQRYLAAWDERDYAAAYAFFSSQVRGTLSEADYLAAAADYARYGRPPNGSARGVFIDGVTDGSTRVTVRLTVEEVVGNGLDTSVYRSPRTVALVREGTEWRIDEALLWLDQGPYPGPMK
jgi:hypothetical protein